MAEMLARIKSGNVHLRKIEAATSVSLVVMLSFIVVFGHRRRRSQKTI